MYARVLVPTDGSACSDEATAQAVAIARAMGSTILLLFVMDTLNARHEGVVNIAEARQALIAQGTAVVDRGAQIAASEGVRAIGELVEGSPAEEIVRVSEAFDLVVMGSHGKGFLKRLTTGSVTETVLHRIRRPLLVVRAPASP
jgi:nucleotide-binding universal stress UspA family protein